MSPFEQGYVECLQKLGFYMKAAAGPATPPPVGPMARMGQPGKTKPKPPPGFPQAKVNPAMAGASQFPSWMQGATAPK